MALYEYFCDSCKLKFEQICSSQDPDAGLCPQCKKKDTRKLISRFAVGGRGDLRESTMHGCHDCEVPVGGPSASPESGPEDHGHSHDHGHDHGHGHSHDE